MAPSQLGLFTRSSPDYETPNLQFHIQPLSLDRFGEPMHPFGAFTVSVCNLRPTSRGFVRAISRRSERCPLDPAALSADAGGPPGGGGRDPPRSPHRFGGAARRYRPEEYRPGRDCQTDAELEKAAGEIGTTIFHPVGTAKMGVREDPMAVLDERLRVRACRASGSPMPR